MGSGRDQMLFGNSLGTHHYEEEVLLVVETPPEFDHEWVRVLGRHAFEHSLLRQSMLELLMGENVPLRDRLERVHVLRRFVANEEHLPRAALTEHAHHLEVIDDDLALRLLELTVRVFGLGAFLARGSPFCSRD